MSWTWSSFVLSEPARLPELPWSLGTPLPSQERPRKQAPASEPHKPVLVEEAQERRLMLVEEAQGHKPMLAEEERGRILMVAQGEERRP